jgi:hypothetical protein
MFEKIFDCKKLDEDSLQHQIDKTTKYISNYLYEHKDKKLLIEIVNFYSRRTNKQNKRHFGRIRELIIQLIDEGYVTGTVYEVHFYLMCLYYTEKRGYEYDYVIDQLSRYPEAWLGLKASEEYGIDLEKDQPMFQ